ncbi:hypothetical protein CEXT_280601 [Caerostris extrusa]|uniref:Uncharacterized protein n=1 Tax=Caerostris extrusa TaxID=172846 RepID=A0AAV4PS06_CAEEX|nr:hypothetical protein CEXT_280601 [Caerostris extrusa]
MPNQISFCHSLLTVTLFLFEYGLCFNLETRLPIIKDGPEGSYFGYSVAQHQIIDEEGRRESVRSPSTTRSETQYLYQLPPENVLELPHPYLVFVVRGGGGCVAYNALH